MTIRQKTTIKMRVSADCPSHSRTDVTVRDTSTVIDEPAERGGTNLGPAPTETAVAALIGCTNTIGNKCAAALGVDIGTLRIDAVCTFDRRGVTLAEDIAVPFEAIELTVKANGPATQEELERVAVETEKFCPLSKLFIGAGTKLEVTWQKN